MENVCLKVHQDNPETAQVCLLSGIWVLPVQFMTRIILPGKGWYFYATSVFTAHYLLRTTLEQTAIYTICLNKHKPTSCFQLIKVCLTETVPEHKQGLKQQRKNDRSVKDDSHRPRILHSMLTSILNPIFPPLPGYVFTHPPLGSQYHRAQQALYSKLKARLRGSFCVCCYHKVNAVKTCMQGHP